MTTLTNMLISASAGTGKTYRLSLRFLGLLALTGGKHPERLIAITFTKKAAGEFKDRILTDLATGAKDDDGAERLKKQLWEVIKGTPEMPGIWPDVTDDWAQNNLTKTRFRQLLHILVQNLARLNLCTIDSLFAQISSTSAFELGFSGFKIIDSTEEAQARKEALLSLYRECSADEQLSKDFEDAFLSGSESTADAIQAEKTMTKRLNAFHALFLEAPEEEKWGNPTELGFTPKDLIPAVPLEQFNTVLQSLISQAQQAPDPEEKKGKKNKELFLRFLNAFSQYAKLGRVRFRTEGGSVWNITVEQAREKFKEFWTPDLEKIIQSWLCMESIQTLRRTRATYKLMTLFEKKYSALIRNRGRFLFHDITRILGDGAITPELKQELQYRMYCRYDHWMLDEFQDTSQSQWRVIKPFLDDLIESKNSQDGSIFVVGDIKQSVYQWRGGDPTLFNSVADQLQLQTCGMATSFRSVQPVLNMANDICNYKQSASDCLLNSTLEQWGDYPEHHCAPHLQERPGVAQIWETPYSKDKNKDEQVGQTIVDILNQTQAIERGLDTAILISTGDQAKKVKSILTQSGIPAEVCDDVNVGVDSPLGKDLLLFFRWLQMPGDTLTTELLSHSPLRPLISPNCPEGMNWQQWRLLLERNGYATIMEELERRLIRSGIKLTKFQQSRLSVWQNEAEQVDGQGMPLDIWLNHMEELVRREDPPKGIVRIMTIHKSKGLGFDIVIIPQIGNKQALANETHLEHFEKKDANDRIEGIVLAPSKDVYNNVPQFHRLLLNWKSQQEFDGCCRLYVALTRAKRATYIILPGKKNNKASNDDNNDAVSFWQLIQRAAKYSSKGSDSLSLGDAKCLYSDGQPDWYKGVPLKKQEHEEIILKQWPEQKPIIRERISPSGQHSQTSFFKKQQNEDMRKAAEFGTAVHAVFERITRWDDANKPEWALHPTTEAELTVAECMEVPSIRELFTPPLEASIMKEQRIEAIEGNNWISGVIDRLIIHHDSATIIDFKTDRVSSAEQLKDRHAEQLTAYARIVSRITGIPQEKISCIIISTYLKEAFPI